MSDPPPLLRWTEAGADRSARWRSESLSPPPGRVVVADDRTRADDAFRRACEGAWLLYRGTWGNLRQLLAAMARRVEARRRVPDGSPADPREAFQAYRRHKAYEHQVLSRLLVELDADYRLRLLRGPEVAAACREVWGAAEAPTVAPLRALLGLVGAHEWRKAGLRLEALGEQRLRPHYGVFAPVRSEYVDLVAAAPLGAARTAFDLGTGTGVLALVLARRGVDRILATDVDPRALACARENVEAFGLAGRIEVLGRDLFPEGRADLLVFNPPWIPERPRTPVERALFDPGNALVHRFLAELLEHLTPGGEGWLVLSDLGERLGLQPEGFVREAARARGLRLLGEDSRPARHPRARDASDPLFAARSREITRLYRFGAPL